MQRLSLVLTGLTLVAHAVAQPHSAPSPSALRERAIAAMERGARYLIAAQDKDGAWAADTGPGVTAICVRALALTPGVGPHHAAVQRGGDFVLRSQRESGGIYSAEGRLPNYETSVALSMLAVLKDDRFREAIAAAQTFVKKCQLDEEEGKSIDDPAYGGSGYGRSAADRPDLSNTQIMLDALRDSGVPPDDPAYKKALIFIRRCQMLGETNDQPFAKGSTQGGFVYSAAAGGESKAGTIEIDGRTELRCYGSMTYAGLKSMIYAGLSRDDPRVRAAYQWITDHWTLDRNPNMPDAQARQGLFYYYHTFARALAAYGDAKITDKLGREHDWRAELLEKLTSIQKDDGSWVNEADRWFEGKPALTTAYAMLALHAAFFDAPGS